ncbi:unnamed protein product [Euphydryas editha]|uniref:Uncharacterized protein n=1 Tax=Euphydryas editha TaxID=104508 RepID=A0AAU9U0P0_EUPED|nr:unnamed protein product [Euphydryas editha]
MGTTISVRKSNLEVVDENIYLEQKALLVHVLRDSELPLELASALGPDVQFVLKYVDPGMIFYFYMISTINHFILVLYSVVEVK